MLIYSSKKMVRLKELFLLSHHLIFVGETGFEPATPWSQTKCANRTALHPALCGMIIPLNRVQSYAIFF